MKENYWKKTGLFAGVLGLALFGYFQVPSFFAVKFAQEGTNIETLPPEPPAPPPKVVTHIETPEVVKGIYMTSYVAATPSIRANVVKVIDETEINSIVIDIKDYRGRIAFLVNDPELKKIGSDENLVRDIDEFLEMLHAKNIYVIGRISVFQDAFLINHWKNLAVKTKSGEIWKDRKGISWFDAGAKEVWDYTIAIAKESYARGFDELNFDYIRFPSDGNMKDIAFPVSQNRPKAEVLEEFFVYLHENLRDTGAKTSADLFGMTMTNFDDLGIGQVLERTAPYFDFICPMVYPSHYPTGWNGYKNPASVPYEVISYSMKRASNRLIAMGEDPQKLRPWLQDFNLGATYTAEMVKREIQAVYDSGLTSWLLWSPSNKYTIGALKKE